ncbi:cystathionine beta-lyase [Alcaligenes faecalis]|uniref:cystathionine beta-lyase n=1 Tax=Alcaligenes faecalis TaxID=511 RepID=UPI0029324C1D|nr:cystathionine beta-lyase [Alcaligenes faecalis]MDV2116295.1 cystathionine beta-lyase [Alcaligenes faecalis]
MSSDLALDTALQHTGLAPFDPHTDAAPVAVPIMRTSTVRFRNLDALDRAQADKADPEKRSVTYGRSGMDTHAALEQVFCQLESATQALLAPSGMAAITLGLLALLDSGDHVLIADSAYGPVRYLEKTVLRRMGIQATFCAPTPEEMARHLQDNTRMVYVESPGSLLMQMLDMPALAQFGRQHNLLLVTDNTWGSGYIYRPLELGFDVSIVAGTKYVAGHSDLMLGAVMSADPAINKRLHDNHYALGFSISADDAWLALRGVRTLPIRMRESASNALAVCQFLDSRPEVVRIYHPAWPQDPGHALWQRDCTGSNGMLSVQLKLNNAQARVFVDALTLFGIGFSWGGFESLVQLVDTSFLSGHSYWEQSQDSLVRLHIGLESTKDLCADLTQAFEKAALA